MGSLRGITAGFGTIQLPAGPRVSAEPQSMHVNPGPVDDRHRLFLMPPNAPAATARARNNPTATNSSVCIARSIHLLQYKNTDYLVLVTA